MRRCRLLRESVRNRRPWRFRIRDITSCRRFLLSRCAWATVGDHPRLRRAKRNDTSSSSQPHTLGLPALLATLWGIYLPPECITLYAFGRRVFLTHVNRRPANSCSPIVQAFLARFTLPPGRCECASRSSRSAVCSCSWHRGVGALKRETAWGQPCRPTTRVPNQDYGQLSFGDVPRRNRRALRICTPGCSVRWGDEKYQVGMPVAVVFI